MTLVATGYGRLSGAAYLLFRLYVVNTGQANSTARPYPVRPRPFGVKGTKKAAQRTGENGLLSALCPLSTNPRPKLAPVLG